MVESKSIFHRLWIYQDERFPLIKVLPLLAAFVLASHMVASAALQDQLFDLQRFFIGFALVVIIFFQMRVCDEIKDFSDDLAYRPERPIPRGLVGLREIIGLGLITVPIAAGLAVLWGQGLIWLLLLVWIWLFAMTFEFGAPEWLKAHPLTYLLSHMVIMPLLALMLTGMIWQSHSVIPMSVILFLALTFFNGSILEIGRKLLTKENEREGVDTYSKLWGRRAGVLAWLTCIGFSSLILLAIGWVIQTFLPMAVFGIVMFGICIRAGWAYATSPNDRTQGYVDTLSAIWVLFSYVSLAFVPLVWGAVQ